jgi:hypothetical protein
MISFSSTRRLVSVSTASLVLLCAACSSGGDSDGTGLLDLNNPAAGPGLTLTGPTQLGSGSSGSYTARLVGGDGKGVTQTPITLATTLGTLSMSSTDSTTDANGDLAFTLAARTAPTTTNGQTTPGTPVTGTATLTASGAISGKTYTATLTVQMTPTTFAFTSPTSTTANPATVPVNVSQALGFQWVSNSVAVNAPVTFSTTLGLLSDSAGDTAATITVSTQNGVASLGIVSTKVGTATVTATDSSGQYMASIPIQFTGGTPATITLTAASPIANNGTSTVTAVVKDAGGNAVNNVAVTFALGSGSPSGGTLSNTSANTGTSGSASVLYNANGAAGTATVQATVGTLAPVSQSIVINP